MIFCMCHSAPAHAEILSCPLPCSLPNFMRHLRYRFVCCTRLRVQRCKVDEGLTAVCWAVRTRRRVCFHNAAYAGVF